MRFREVANVEEYSYVLFFFFARSFASWKGGKTLVAGGSGSDFTVIKSRSGYAMVAERNVV